MGGTFSRFTVSRKWGNAIALAACLYFFVAGQAFLVRLGIENDEAIFANPLFDPAAAYYKIGTPGVPLMVTSYAGTLKTWLYAAVFHILGTGTRQLREPTLIAATVSLWLFFLLMRRAAGTRAAAVGVCLLAVDAEYLLTSCYDWGPVALQHLLLLGGTLLAIRFCQTRGAVALAGASFLMGLAMWDKALAVWLLSGMAIAAVAVYRKRLASLFTMRRAAIAVAAFSVGALPLIVFNVNSGLATFRSNTARDTIPMAAKARFLLDAAEGGSLFSYLTRDDWETPAPHRPSSAWEKLSAKVSELAGHPRRSGLAFVFFAALLLAPLAGGPAIRAILFCLITGVIAWIEMAVNANTGASVHHTILLWPLPQAVIAISFAAASRRLGRAGLPALGAGLALFAAIGILVTNEYRAHMVRNGATIAWTEALFPLHESLHGRTQSIFCMDWGMLNSLLLLSNGQLKLFVGTDAIYPIRNAGADDLRSVKWMLDQPDAEFVAHTASAEFFRGASERLTEIASGLGYRRVAIATVSDGFGRNVFQVYRFEPAAQ